MKIQGAVMLNRFRRLSSCCIAVAVLLNGQVVLGFQVLWNEVHETITTEALERARVDILKLPDTSGTHLDSEQYDVFLAAVIGDNGVRYPDIPEGLDVFIAILIARGVEGFFDVVSQNQFLTEQSHYGNLQYWHAMGSKSTPTLVTYNEIITQLSAWANKAHEAFEQGKLRIAGEYWGRLLHTVQDSYSNTHTDRSNSFISEFYDYSTQSSPHYSGDMALNAMANNESYRDLAMILPGAAEAMARTQALTVAFLGGDRCLVDRILEDVFKLEDKPFRPCNATDELRVLARSMNAFDDEEIERILRDGANVEVAVNVGVPHDEITDSEILKECYTPLFVAVRNGFSNIVDLLLSEGASPEALPGSIQAPLYISALRGEDEILTRLIEAGANVNVVIPGAGYTPLFVSARDGHSGVVRQLLKAGALVDGTHEGGMTPLHMAGFNDHREVVDLLLEANVSVNQQGGIEGYAAIHGAAGVDSGSSDIVLALLRAGADVNILTNKNVSALHCAAHVGNEEIVRVLLESGAKANLVDDYGITPLGRADAGGFMEVSRILKAFGAK